MLSTYLSEDAARDQIKRLETGYWVAKQGKSASWQNLINALDEFIKLCNEYKYDEAAAQWNGAVGNAQQQLPVHVVNQYCHPTRSFKTCPNFANEAKLPRCRKTQSGDWFTCSYNGWVIGKAHFALCRGSKSAVRMCTQVVWGKAYKCVTKLLAIADHYVLVAYLKNQTQLRDQLTRDLTNGANYSSYKLTL